MKKIERAFLVVSCFLFLTTGLYAARAKAAAKAPKDVWVAKEKNGTLLTLNQDGWARLDFGQEVDFEGYKYLQVECSSPDGKKFSFVEFYFVFVPEDNPDFDWDQSAKIKVYNIDKKPALYQGAIYGPNMCYEHWEDGKKMYRNPEAAVADHIDIVAYDDNWKHIPNVKIYVKKVVATNNAVGQLHVIDFAKARFFTINQPTTWDDGSKHYGYWADLQQLLGTAPKAGDIVQLKLKGTNAYDVGVIQASVHDDGANWQPVTTDWLGRGYAKGQKVNDTIDLPILKNGSKLILEIVTFEDESDAKGPYLIYSK